MPLSPGDKLGPYEILAAIGAGGMGAVYEARDTRLHRTVAIKVSLEQFSERFENEARAVAALNHPHICQLYDVGPNYLVMEFIEGAPLTGPLPLEKAVEYAGQILDALDAAHQKGITHRDLKPDNILVTKQGIKLLDFGLAKRQGAALKETDATLTQALTTEGQVLGTLQYMSPEQLHGKPADARSDLFSFGCVLYETLTGKRAFEGTSAASVIAAILEREPAPMTTASPLARILKRCLAKDPDLRFQTARDLKAALTWALEQPAPAVATPRAPRVWIVATVALTVSLIVLGAMFWRSTRPVARPLALLNVDLGPEAVAGRFTTAVISPDGSRLVFPARSPDGKQMLATRLLEEAKPAFLPGTEDGRDPFFSPDGQWVGFFADAKMKKISVRGGAPVVLCDASDARGGTWGDDGNIIAALNLRNALSRVSAEGGRPQPITKLHGDGVSHYWPQILPGGETVLFTVPRSQVTFEDAMIAGASMKTGEPKVLVRGGYFGRYMPSDDAVGYVVYIHEGVLFGVPFDPRRLELRGKAVPLLDDVAADPSSGGGQFSFTAAPSGSGMLTYFAGKVAPQAWLVSWLEKSGKTQPLISAPGIYMAPRFSPDGQRLAVARAGTNGGIFVHDLQRDTTSRLTFDTDVQQSNYPTWSPDGEHIVFRSLSAGKGMGWIRADGAGETQLLLDGEGNPNPYSFFPKGSRLAYAVHDPNSGWDIWTLALDLSDPDHPKPGKTEPFLRTPANELRPAVSPDGHWIAYQSDESGLDEIYVRPFPASPGGSGKWQISNTGGTLPIWSKADKALFFENLDHRIMVASYELKSESFAAGQPHLWSDQKLQNSGGYLNYDVAPDGKRFAIFPELQAPAGQKGNVHITFLLNFVDELRRRVPVGK